MSVMRECDDERVMGECDGEQRDDESVVGRGDDEARLVMIVDDGDEHVKDKALGSILSSTTPPSPLFVFFLSPSWIQSAFGTQTPEVVPFQVKTMSWSC
jgi:hypothetical protein